MAKKKATNQSQIDCRPLKVRNHPKISVWRWVYSLCHISLEISWRGLQLCFKLHLNQRVSQTIITFQNVESLNFKKIRTPKLTILIQSDIWMQLLWLIVKNIIRGKVGSSPKSRSWWILWVRVCSWFVYAPAMFQPCTNQFIALFVQVHVNNWPSFHSS
jgi:hypothetical protein